MSDLVPPHTPTLSWEVPLVDGTTRQIDAVAGEVITVVGANGAGKSALATWITVQTPKEKRRRVLAQRRLWFANSGPNLSASGRENLTSNMEYWDSSSDSRFVDHADGQRTDAALFDLLGKIAAEDHQVATLSQVERRSPDEIDEIVGPRLFDVLNDVLSRAGLAIRVETTDKQTFAAVHRDLGAQYSIAQMSDGERGALLLAAEILVAPDGGVVVVDEPERHLHRSISAGLIEALIEARPDCSFVVLTHDLDLAVALSARPGKTFSSLGVEWLDNEPVRWDLQELSDAEPLTEMARRGILGGRRHVLFVEGTEDSLDRGLYSLLYPEQTVVAVGSCEWVIRSVEGVRATENHHWVHAQGIVDGDGRSEQDRQTLAAKNVHALKVSEIESLYYLPVVLEEVASRVASVDGEDPLRRVQAAKRAGIAALVSNHGIERIATKIATDEVVRKMVSVVPSEVATPTIRIEFNSPYGDLKERLQAFHAADDYENLIRIASIRESAFRAKVAKELGFTSFERYQKAVSLAVSENPVLADRLRREIADGVAE